MSMTHVWCRAARGHKDHWHPILSFGLDDEIFNVFAILCWGTFFWNCYTICRWFVEKLRLSKMLFYLIMWLTYWQLTSSYSFFFLYHHCGNLLFAVIKFKSNIFLKIVQLSCFNIWYFLRSNMDKLLQLMSQLIWKTFSRIWLLFYFYPVFTKFMATITTDKRAVFKIVSNNEIKLN